MRGGHEDKEWKKITRSISPGGAGEALDLVCPGDVQDMIVHLPSEKECRHFWQPAPSGG